MTTSAWVVEFWVPIAEVDAGQPVMRPGFSGLETSRLVAKHRSKMPRRGLMYQVLAVLESRVMLAEDYSTMVPLVVESAVQTPWAVAGQLAKLLQLAPAVVGC